MSDAPRPLNPPDVAAVRYTKNFIKTAVCELRFPALLELETKAPHAFQKQIRKAYPVYEPQIVEAGRGEDVLRENQYLFKSADKNWTVSVKTSTISLETTKYIDFEDFYERLMMVLHSAEPLIDADFFTRIGLRYINKITLEDGQPKGWISDELLGPFNNDVLGDVSKYACVLTGTLKNGNYYMRHGMGEGEQTASAKGSKQQYTLDFDYFAENLEAASIPDRLKEFNRTNFSLFHWCLGPKAKDALGEGKAKK